MKVVRRKWQRKQLRKPLRKIKSNRRGKAKSSFLAVTTGLQKHTPMAKLL